MNVNPIQTPYYNLCPPCIQHCHQVGLFSIPLLVGGTYLTGASPHPWTIILMIRINTTTLPFVRESLPKHIEDKDLTVLK